MIDCITSHNKNESTNSSLSFVISEDILSKKKKKKSVELANCERHKELTPAAKLVF